MRTRWVPYVFDDIAWGEAVKRAIASLGTKDLCQLCEVSVSTVNRWAAGASGGANARPSMENFLTICNLLDTFPGEFFKMGE